MKQSPYPTPPPDFIDRMRRILPAGEMAAFLNTFDHPPPVGLRVNTLKISVADFISIAPFSLAPAGEWDPAAFLVTDDSRPGRHPYHDAGLYYLQDPSAMVAAAILAPARNDWVLDLAAAPGGKATHLAAIMPGAPAATASPLRQALSSAADPGRKGLLIANDVHAGRARLLAENLARWGATGTLVTQDDPERLAGHLGPIFDRVLLDAPCSGEGMFHRQEGIEWSPAIVAACARRQSRILAAIPRLVRPGGHLLYATCTFAPEENEQTIATFLAANPDFQLVDPPRFAGFAEGRAEWTHAPDEIAAQLTRAIRLWPHQFPGGGHFLALLKRQAEARLAAVTVTEFRRRPPARPEMNQWQSFAAAALSIDLSADRLHTHQNHLYLLPSTTIDTSRLHLVRTGLLLGEFGKGHFRPAHDLALALRAEDCRQSMTWLPDAPSLHAYLAGEEVTSAGPDGWVLVTVQGFGLGWGKRGRNRLKNHYPRRLRRAIVNL